MYGDALGVGLDGRFIIDDAGLRSLSNPRVVGYSDSRVEA